MIHSEANHFSCELVRLDIPIPKERNRKGVTGFEPIQTLKS
jgi:hypothetical protein